MTNVIYGSLLLQRLFLKNEPPDFPPLMYNGQEVSLPLGHQYKKFGKQVAGSYGPSWNFQSARSSSLSLTLPQNCKK